MLWAKEGRMSEQVEREEVAIGNELRKYRKNYLQREVASSAAQPFVRFTRQLCVLLPSHCSNMLLVAPDRVAGVLQEWASVTADVLDKYYSLSLRFTQRVGDLPPETRPPPAELCLLCAQQIKKVEVDRVRRHILNEADLYQLADDAHQDPPAEDEDLAFFADLSELLSRRQGELLRNQLSMGLYQEEAAAALASLVALKDSFTVTPTPPPNLDWQSAAQQELETQLKKGFMGKMPAWIAKMMRMFWLAQERRERSQAGVQTGVSGQAEVVELKRKMLLAKEKQEKTAQRLVTQEKELAAAAADRKELEMRVDYYRNQLTKLIEEIEHIKSQNQLIRLKLTRGFPEEEKPSSLDLRPQPTPRDNHPKKPKTLLASLEKGLPRIKRASQQNGREKRESQTSIGLMSLNQSRSERPSLRKEKISGLSFGSSYQELNREKESEANERLDREELKRQSNVIQEEEGQTYLEEEKKKMEQVSTQLREIVRNIQVAPSTKQNTLSSLQPKDTLKRVPRKTNHYVPHSPPPSPPSSPSPDSLSKTPPNWEVSSGEIEDVLGKIFAHLRQEGLLVKINEEEFKTSILNIQNLNLKVLASAEVKHAVESGRVMDQSLLVRNQRLSVTRKQWNNQSYHMESEEKPISEQQLREYFSLFCSQQNAYNYECSLTKNHLKGGYHMSCLEETACSDFYKLIEQIKKTSLQHYKFICSYLRYPFQLMQNQFTALNLVNQMSYQNFHHYFLRILSMHVKCNRKADALCQHLQQVRTNLHRNVASLQS